MHTLTLLISFLEQFTILFIYLPFILLLFSCSVLFFLHFPWDHNWDLHAFWSCFSLHLVVAKQNPSEGSFQEPIWPDMISFYVDYENKWKSMQNKHLSKQKNNRKIKKLFHARLWIKCLVIKKNKTKTLSFQWIYDCSLLSPRSANFLKKML